MADVLAFDALAIVHEGQRKSLSRILDGVSFAIAPGEALGLVGESGCGKSTVALAAMQYLPQGMRVASGRILLEGRDLATMGQAELRRLRGNRLAMIYQDPLSSLNPVMTIGAQLAEVALLHGERDPRKARERAIGMLDEVRLVDPDALVARYPHELSGGQQQRVVIAMALMAEPRLLIMDEPTTGLDVTIEAAILDLVRDLRRRFGTAVLFISHNLGTVAQICDRIGVLYAGRIVEMGRVADVFKKPAHPYTRGLLDALPLIEGKGRPRRLAPIEGMITVADRAREGCAFAPRCPHHQRACDAPVPMFALQGEGKHEVRCIRSFEIGAHGRVHDQTADTDHGVRPAVLSTTDLSKRYRLKGLLSRSGDADVRALTEVSIEARSGSTLAIVGESGCGKSTLARIIAGLTTATRGQAEFAGVDLAATPVQSRPADVRRRIQMVFQDPESTLNPSHSIEYALARPLQKLKGLSSKEAYAEVDRLMERVRLPAELKSRRPHQLSGGQRQRVAIARALAGDPDVVIADEPVSALDVSVQASIINLLEDLISTTSLGLILISHDLALVHHMADWVAVMYLGRVVEYGHADLVFKGPQHPYTEALLAAAPKLEATSAGQEIVLSGAMPSPRVEIAGCAFASRCPRKVGEICDNTAPPARRAGEHRIACHLPLFDGREASAKAP